MFGSTKVKIAAGLATGALTLGAAGAYAANNGTIPASNLKPVTLTPATGTATTTTSNSLNLVSVNGKTASLTLPANFSNQGQCISFFAQHQDLMLAPAAGTARVSKNGHGKLMSSSTIRTWCAAMIKKATTTDSSDTQTAETPDATQPETTDATDSTDATNSTSTHGKSGQAHGTGHGRGHSND